MLAIKPDQQSWLMERANDIVVRVEKAIKGQRRFDISIELKGMDGFEVVIENKFGAGDQKEQLDDYQEYLEGSHPGNHHLIYLTPEGSEPSERSWNAGKTKVGQDNGQSFQLMSYRNDILPLLKIWETVAKVPRIGSFVREFYNHLEVRLNGGRHMTNTNEVAGEITASGSAVEAAFAIEAAMGKVRMQLLDRLVQTIQQILGHEYLVTTGGKDWQKAYFDFSIARKSPAWKTFQIGFQFANGGLNGLYFGISAKLQGRYKPTTDEAAIIDGNLLGFTRKEGWWACHQDAEKNIPTGVITPTFGDRWNRAITSPSS